MIRSLISRPDEFEFGSSSCIGRGGTANVWAAQHLPTKTEMVIKYVVKSMYAAIEERALTELGNKWVEDRPPPFPRLHKQFQKNGMVLVMSPHGVEATTHNVSKRHLADILDAIRHAHACGIGHRDIRLQNIIVLDESHACLIDWGCAAPLGKEVCFEGTVVFASQSILSKITSNLSAPVTYSASDDLESWVKTAMRILAPEQLDEAHYCNYKKVGVASLYRTWHNAIARSKMFQEALRYATAEDYDGLNRWLEMMD